MIKKLLKNWKIYCLIALLFFNVFIWSGVFALSPSKHVTVSFLNVGQGDAILIEATNKNHILIDGGRGKIVLGELGRILPFFNRTIDVMIETHPDADHIGGLPEVIKRYKVGLFFEPGVESDNAIDDELKGRVKEKNITDILARAGQIIDLGDGSYLRILFPDRDVSGLDTNDASVVAQYIYGDTCFHLTGDSTIKIEDYLIEIYGKKLKCNVLKAGHHGSRTSTSEEYVLAIAPEVAIISAGKNNSYGHPHAEVIERLKNHNIKILSTIDSGTIKLFSDGEKILGK